MYRPGDIKTHETIKSIGVGCAPAHLLARAADGLIADLRSRVLRHPVALNLGFEVKEPNNHYTLQEPKTEPIKEPLEERLHGTLRSQYPLFKEFTLNREVQPL